MHVQRIRRMLWVAMPLSLLASFLVLGPGCEDEPSDNDVDKFFEEHPYVSDPRHDTGRIVLQVEPASATVSDIGDKVLFTASGGKLPYTWAVTTPAAGSIAKQGDYKAIYTAGAVAPNTVVVYDRNGDAALATINGSALIIQPPGPITVAQGGTQTFKALGGAGGYLWTVSDQSLGTLDTDEGETVTYTGNTNSESGDNIITVYDAKNNAASVTITQQ